MTDPNSMSQNARSGSADELRRIFDVLRRRWIFVVACIVGGAGRALGLSLAPTKKYTASAYRV
jgi:uncharacterized protein involved in exopolysaccharide biosynthesis